MFAAFVGLTAIVVSLWGPTLSQSRSALPAKEPGCAVRVETQATPEMPPPPGPFVPPEAFSVKLMSSLSSRSFADPASAIVAPTIKRPRTIPSANTRRITAYLPQGCGDNLRAGSREKKTRALTRMLAWRAARRTVRPIVIPLETLRAAPKVLLHDHLDGGLRPATIVELARDQDYRDLPTTDPAELGAWFHASAASGSLSLYLRGFAHTIAVMQTEEAVERVAYECGEDLARDGVVYAEVRYAPVFHTQRGLNLEQVVQSVQ